MRLVPFVIACSLVGCLVAQDPSPVVRPAAMRAAPRWSPWEVAPRPPARRFASVTPTPQGVVIFGGLGRDGPLGDGWRWDGDAWTSLPSEGAPTPRAGHTAVWAGDRLCVWGGVPSGEGACWAPGASAWRPMSTIDAPSARSGHSAIWTGAALMVFGGKDSEGEALSDGALYDPRTDVWRALPDGGPKARWGAVLARDASSGRVALWGGAGESLALGGDDAAWFDPRGPRWEPLATEGAPLLGSGPQSVVGAQGIVVLAAEPARFDHADGRWRRTSRDGAPPARVSTTTLTAPDVAVFWGGLDADGPRGDGAAYHVREDRWIPLPTEGAPSARSDATGFWDGRVARVLWGADARGLCDDAYTLAL